MNETFNIKELSEYLKCSISGIRNLVRSKKIPYYRIGNRIFFRKETIDLWIKNQEVQNIQSNNYEAKIKSLKSEVK